ncbi:TetR family transcriptional regulator [Erysipelothrix sp. HDW6C]|uniref:TetR/AcrR family transcriptional regulator C-terminal domain-containing protein n=1 Tax=Erysipelothrix sp. HDW6C TaxID=2714930 RepID=UPI001408B41A|nr:TetR/AcrR family transcriptional regulator C-terminal domain-containing protein [Erysipelothrix sp. HDW6C]QIK69108.1 TetR family transcriptional regulator [Erysipelothrix sp. HDW6C]
MKTDLRVVKTHRDLTQALLRLLERDNFASITVNDICVEALVGRSTFYDHFEDKYSLLELLFKTERMSTREHAQSEATLDLIKSVLYMIKENEVIFRNLLPLNEDQQIVELIRSTWLEDVLKYNETHLENGDLKDVPLEFISDFLAGGYTMGIIDWIHNGLKTSVEDMALYQYKMLHQFVKP